MKFAPIPENALATPVSIVISTGQTAYGGTVDLAIAGKKCRLIEKTTQRLDAERRLITLSGTVYLSGDIAPALDVIESGTVTIGGKTWQIYSAERPRNPDGTVHHTKLLLK